MRPVDREPTAQEIKMLEALPQLLLDIQVAGFLNTLPTTCDICGCLIKPTENCPNCVLRAHRSAAAGFGWHSRLEQPA